MKNSQAAGHSHFIAINSHNAHDQCETYLCCRSVIVAAEPLMQTLGVSVRVVLFHHADRPLSDKIVTDIKKLGIEVRQYPRSANGPGLNIQIKEAMSCRFDFFYRVDADDTVFACRFVRQSAILTSTKHDLCGGGLVYRNVVTGQSFNVLPKETPGAGEFLANHFFLHPTIALRLASIRSGNIRYWSRRLEDKQMALQFDARRLSVYNDQVLYGEYNLNPQARNQRRFATLNLKLNLQFLKQNHMYLAYPVAWLMYLLHLTFSNHFLRKLRNKLSFLRKPAVGSEP